MHRIIGVVFSDLHYENWKQFNQNGRRLDYNEDVLKIVSKAAQQNKCPLLFTGDWYHSPKVLENKVFVHSLRALNRHIQIPKVNLYAISGNHDFSETNYPDKAGSTYLDGLAAAFSYFHNMDFRSMSFEHFNLHGIPYINGNKDFEKTLELIKETGNYKRGNKPDILMIHTSLHGAKEPDGHESTGVDNIPLKMSQFFKGFDLVLDGHIHRPQRLGKKIQIVGASNHQRVSDEGCEMGYFLLTQNLELIFKPFHLPQFISIPEDEEIPDDYNFYIKIPKESGIKETLKSQEFDVNLGAVRLAKNYLKHTGIKSKAKKRTLIKLLKDV